MADTIAMWIGYVVIAGVGFVAVGGYLFWAASLIHYAWFWRPAAVEKRQREARERNANHQPIKITMAAIPSKYLRAAEEHMLKLKEQSTDGAKEGG